MDLPKIHWNRRPYMDSLNTAACLKALKDGGLTHTDIVTLIKEEGRDAVLAMGAEELRKQNDGD